MHGNCRNWPLIIIYTVDRKSNFEMNACEAYEAVKLQRSPEYQMHHDVHYETVFF